MYSALIWISESDTDCLLISLDTFYLINIALLALNKKKGAKESQLYLPSHTNLIIGIAYSQNAAAQLIPGLPALTTFSFITAGD